ncbi:NCS1 family nucleobase:cation symporter-1 [Exophiala viscosa]|uniref:NCS1 family nucleobase:cation symporter-1 n=1 Tax=Exophiala viscosa TaxID=2486360 RepID=UPI002197CA6C|nr:NCS1 family nucleobase:cation symporter-1 [Exophiala viscosa]
MKLTWTSLREALQVPKDEESYYDNTQWCNRDLIPLPPERRTFGVWSYAGYWVVTGCNVSAWSIGATLLGLGLSPQHAIGVVVVGGILAGILAVVCGWIGAKHHIGYTVSSRFSWGMYGSYFPVILRTFVGCIWFGIQAFWGGQATRVLWGAIIPGFAHMKNTFSESSHLATNDFIGLVIWMFAFVALVMVRPEKMQIPFFISFVLVAGSFIGILIWAVHNAHGAGAMFHTPATAPNLGAAWMYGITAVLGAWGGGTVGQSDWTRYANKRLAPTTSQMVVAPFTITVTALVGIIVTSAAKDVLGSLIWSPIALLGEIQELNHSSPRARAGVFFASLGLVSSQLMVSVVLNSMSVGMDMSGLWPRYINIRRGSYIMAAVGIIVQPWHLLNTAAKFLRVMSSFGIFLAPATGILIADYHLIRQRKLKMDELYIGNRSSIYWYSKGLNWRAFVAFAFGMWPMLPGLAASVNGYTAPSWAGWIQLYNLTFIIGTAISGVLFWVLSISFPPPGLHQESAFVGEALPMNENYHAEDQAIGVQQTKEKEPATLDVSV